MDLYKVKRNPDHIYRELQKFYSNTTAVDSETLHKDCVKAMKAFALSKRPDLAQRLFKDYPDDDAVHTWAITICGKKNHRLAIDLLNYQQRQNPPSIAAFNAAIASCSKRNQGYWEDALRVFNRVPGNILSTVTVGALLTCFVKAKRGKEAKEILERIRKSDLEPDRSCYVQTIRALAREGDPDSAYEVLQILIDESRFEARENEYLAVSNAYRKAGNSTMANMLVNTTDDFQYWDYPGLVRRERSNNLPSFWELGEYREKDTRIVVGLQPNKNPRVNGIRIVFIKERKVGFLLMKNTENSSMLLGYFVDPCLRKRGLSKVWAAIWLKLCLHAKLKAVTGPIHKPLICSTLESLGMSPSVENPGVQVQLAPSKDDSTGIVLYSSSKDLKGVMSVTDRNSQNIIVTTEPLVNAKTCHLSASFVQNTDLMETRVNRALEDRFRFEINSNDLRRVFLGK